ncbi:MAG: sugar transferase [Clostridia bacterium]|nr:sugar transferase [Clostridia bacterium]
MINLTTPIPKEDDGVRKAGNKGPYEAFFKRLIDIIISALFIILFFWLYLIIAIIVRINLGSPVLFTQDRPGKNGKLFKLYKFRSMTDARDENGELLSNRERLTTFGKILRSTSLDELPEFFNILKGDMSFVGPRPLLTSYLEQYNSFEMRRHEARPGLTGLSQVSGRRDLPWKERFEKDVEYVDNITFLGDLKIVWTTIKKVFKREGTAHFQGIGWISNYFNGHPRAGEDMQEKK